MTDKDKTPEDLAEAFTLTREVLVTLPYCKQSVCEAVTTEQIAAYLAGYEAGRPKWVKADETPPSIRKMCLGHFEVTPDYWSTPFVVFFAETLPETERSMFLDQCGNHLRPEFKRLLEYLELPPTKED